MLALAGYYIFTDKEDYLSRISHNRFGDTYLERMLIEHDNPKKFPTAYQYCEPYYNEDCGRLYPCSLEKAKTMIEKECLKYADILRQLKELDKIKEI